MEADVKLSTTDQNHKRHEEDLQRLRGFRLFDDDFMTKCFEDSPECVELVLHIILDKPDLKVEEVRTQYFIKNLLKRSVRLDIFATDSEGKKYNIEVQRADKGAGAKRARYNSSLMDANILPAGDDFEQLPETYVIFITEKDVIGKGQILYQIERCVMETGEVFGDGSHILYVNGAYEEDTPLGLLMKDFFCTNPSDMYYSVLAERTRYFKEDKEGVAVMCKVMEDMRNESLEEGREIGKREEMEKIALRMMQSGKYALEEIAEITGLSVEELKTLDTKREA